MAEVDDEESQRVDGARAERRASWAKIAGAAVAALVLLTTAVVWRWRADVERAERVGQLDAMTEETVARVTTILLRYSDLLASLQAFVTTSDVTHGGFQTFADRAGIASRPGITAAAFIARVPTADVDDLIERERAGGQPDFAVALTAEAPVHAIVTRAWPAASALDGIDLAGDPDRWTALEQSLDQGYASVATSATVLHRDGFSEGDHPLLQVYTPVFRPGAPTSTVDERRAAATGWVGISIDLTETIADLRLAESVLDVAMRMRGSDVVAESRFGAAERIAAADLRGEATIDLVVQEVSVTSTFAPGYETGGSLWAIAIGGTMTALAAGYATFTSMRYRRGLVVRAEAERRRAEVMSSRFHAAVDQAPVGVAVSRMDGSIELVNARMRELMRTGDAEVRSVMDYLHPDDRVEILRSVRSMTAGEVDHVVSERHLVRHDGTRIWCRLSSSVQRDANGEPSAIVAHVQDIEAERQAIEELRSRSRWFSSIVEHSHDLIVLLDAQGVISWVSPSVSTMVEGDADEVIGLPVTDIVHEDDRGRVLQAIERVRNGEAARVEYRVTNAANDWIWLETSATNRLDDPDVAAIITLSRDVTERHRSTELLAHRAAHDPLTGLPNRAELQGRLGPALVRTSSAGAPLTLAFLDLDGFKEVNDAHGHAVGDSLLRAVARILESEARAGDVLARLGGDEFVLALPGADLTAALAIAERIRRRLGEPITLPDLAEPVQVGASIGLAVATATDSVTTLLHQADLALYEAKRRGRDRVEVSAHGLQGLEAQLDAMLHGIDLTDD